MLINVAVGFLSMLKVKSLECMSMINQKCMFRPRIMNLNADGPVFYPLSIKVDKCSGDCNSVNDPLAKLFVPDVVKNINVKVPNLLARINETRQIVWHETCKCVCRLTSAICNSIQVWNEDKCRCECKEDLINKLVCDRGYTWNPSSCSCKCDKYCDVGQYLDYKNCVCRKRMLSDLVEQCVSIVDESIMYESGSELADCPRMPYIVLFVVFLLASGIISGIFVYYYRNRVKKEDYATVNYSMAGKIDY